MAAVQRSIRIVCELLEAEMFAHVYGSFIKNEQDIVFSKWTQVFILALSQPCDGAAEHHSSVCWGL